MRFVLVASVVLGGCLVAAPGRTQSAPPTNAVQADGAVQADRAWSRATAPHQTIGVAFLTLTSPAGDRLVSASSPVANRVELHQMTMDGNVMRMREVPGLDLPQGQAMALAPGGTHFMLVDLKKALRVGQTFPLRLVFKNSPPEDVMVQVERVGASGPAEAHPQ